MLKTRRYLIHHRWFPFLLGGILLLLMAMLLWKYQNRIQNRPTPVQIVEQYVCEDNAPLPCRKNRESTSSTETSTIGAETLFLNADMTQALTPSTGNQQLRPMIIRQLIAQWYTGFITIPYPTSGNNTIIATGLWMQYKVHTNILSQDDLDRYLQKLGTWYILTGNTIHMIQKQQWGKRKNLYFFKNTYDLYHMWYQVISHRNRINKDKDYRRYNISQSFKLLWNVRVLLPQDLFKFLETAQYDGREEKNYKEGYVIIEGEEVKEYGGGICGASTAIYQGILTNKSLERTKRRPHTKRFSNLYSAVINGKHITTPGIDSAIYAGQIDLHFRNTSDHPIILVANYDGSFSGSEEVFTLGYPYEEGSFEFLHGWYLRHEEPTGSGDETQSVRGWCYTRSINEQEKKSCYREVK